jgi:serine/threonine protein kinase
MTNLPDFANHGYRLIKEIGKNLGGGRIAYLAEDINLSKNVVIKQFQFATSGSSWSGKKEYDREIAVLKSFNHPSIPKYLNDFETPTGFCMVQEYKNAQSLSETRSFTPEEVKQIAVSVLEILVYIQAMIPSVIHRDVKPDNILVDKDINVYLVDFGFARIGTDTVAVSSMGLGTIGFMPPEQLYGKQLTEATDLYGLGATLICLLTGTRSIDMDSLIDDDGKIEFQQKVSKLSIRFIDWLEKMVSPKLKERYANAELALKALRPIYIIRYPSICINESKLEFLATKLGQKYTQSIIISNPTSETILEGSWSVLPHPNDSAYSSLSHDWISFSPKEFKGNQVECHIKVDTSKLMAAKTYNRQLSIKSNATEEDYNIDIIVHTAPLPIGAKSLPYTFLLKLFIVALVLPWLLNFIWSPISFCLITYDNTRSESNLTSSQLIMYSAIAGPLIMGLFLIFMGFAAFLFIIMSIACALLPGMCHSNSSDMTQLVSFIGMFLYCLFGTMLTWGAMIWLPLLIEATKEAVKTVKDNFSVKSIGASEGLFATISVFILGVSISTRILAVASLFGQIVSVILFVSTMMSAGYFLAPVVIRHMKIAKYRASEKNLIRP